MHFVTILDPCISTGESDYRPYELGNDLDVWVKRPDGSNFVGRVWPDDPIHFADYSKPETKVTSSKRLVEFLFCNHRRYTARQFQSKKIIFFDEFLVFLATTLMFHNPIIVSFSPAFNLLKRFNEQHKKRET